MKTHEILENTTLSFNTTCVVAATFKPSDDQAIYCNKLTQGGGVIRTPHRSSKRLQIKDQALVWG